MKYHPQKLKLSILLTTIAILLFFYPNFSFALFENKGKVSITTTDGKLHTFDVVFARSNAEKAKGLMFRKSLADDEGMLFMWNTS